ncbi:MAG TPA: hypothetical protein VMS65_03195 [Polyangiaceae bacterium]|nr:hypothetical protein [Polyangiaceae bacterium]
MLSRAIGLLLLCFLAGCFFKPPGPAEEAGDAAREFNATSRYGELANVLGMTSEGVRKELTVRRAEWGKLVRVVDMELAAIAMDDREHANVLVDFSWTRVDQGTLKTTRVLQVWNNESGNWLLTREKRVSGDLGLFGEAVAMQTETAPHPDVHFETRVIR